MQEIAGYKIKGNIIGSAQVKFENSETANSLKQVEFSIPSNGVYKHRLEVENPGAVNLTVEVYDVSIAEVHEWYRRLKGVII